MEYEKELGVDFDIALSEEHIRKKESAILVWKGKNNTSSAYFMSCRIVPVTSLQYGESVSGIVNSRNMFIQTESSVAKEAAHKNV